MANDREQNSRLALLNTMLTTPHRDLAKVWDVHQTAMAQDPAFYVRMAAWHAEHGDVRDHQEAFAVGLILSPHLEHRDAGLALLREMPPYQVVRIVDFIRGRKFIRRIDPAKLTAEQQADRITRKRAKKAIKRGEPQLAIFCRTGLFRNEPRSLRTEVERYLRDREDDPDWFDSAVLTARKALKRLYAALHIAPSERAQRILFDDDPPPDSRLRVFKLLAEAAKPAQQAKLIKAHRVPYRIAAAVVREMTPAVLAALIESMSAQDLINSIGALKKRGALDNPVLKNQILLKLEQAQSASRVSAFKAEEAIRASGADGGALAMLESVADAQVKAKGRIKEPTALLIDKSASMDLAIELGKRIGAMIAAVRDADAALYVYAFDCIAHPIEPAGDRLADWERAMSDISANQTTSCGAPIVKMMANGQRVEQIIIITDEDENLAPHFGPALQDYRAKLRIDPRIVIVKTLGACDKLERACQDFGFACETFQFLGDYYSLPNLIPLLTRGGRAELLREIMAHPLPCRRPN